MLYNSISYYETTQETTQEKYNLNNNQKRIIELMENDPSITRNELASKLNITSDGVKYNIAKLSSLRIIKREGPTKSGKWIVIK